MRMQHVPFHPLSIIRTIPAEFESSHRPSSSGKQRKNGATDTQANTAKQSPGGVESARNPDNRGRSSAGIVGGGGALYNNNNNAFFYYNKTCFIPI